jgi:putative copper export protein/methionine-rich copper-binding protein CopC
VRFLRRGAAIGIVLLLAAAGGLWAHGALKSSSPKAGSHLAVVPRELRLTFTEVPELATATIRLTGPDSQAVLLGALSKPADSATVLVAPITGRLAAGVYTVSWRMAGKDGHPVSGKFSFVIAPGAAGLAADSARAPADTANAHHDPVAMPTSETAFDAGSAGYVIVRFAGFVALLVVIGAAVFGTLVLGLLSRRGGVAADQVDSSASRAARIGMVAGWVLLVASLARLAAQAIALHGERASDLSLLPALILGTSWGVSWMLQLVAAIVAVASYGMARRSGMRRTGPWTLALLASIVLAASPAFASHAASSPRLQSLAIIVDGIHVFGAAGWLGSLFVVVAAGIPAASSASAEQRAMAIADLIESFSPTAFVFAGIVVASGVFAAWIHVGGFDALISSRYGVLLLAKVAVVVVVGGLGAFNWRFVRPRLKTGEASSALRRNARAELMAALVVLVITAVLVAVPTPLDHI